MRRGGPETSSFVCDTVKPLLDYFGRPNVCFGTDFKGTDFEPLARTPPSPSFVAVAPAPASKPSHRTCSLQVRRRWCSFV